MAVGDLKQLTQQFLIGTNAMQISMSFVMGDNTGTNATLAADWSAGFSPIAALLSNELTNNGVRVADISTNPQVSLLREVSGGDWTVGGVTQKAVPASSAFVVTKYSALRGKNNRGRMYVPGLAEDDQDLGLIVNTPLTNLTSAFNTFLGAISSTTGSGNVYVPSVFSYIGVPPGKNRVPSGVTPLVSLFVQRVMRNQRRRQVGVSRRGRRKTV